MRDRETLSAALLAQGVVEHLHMLVGTHPQRILTVSELTVLVRGRLEQSFPEVWVEGELSNLRTPASGHLYFTLKDTQTQIRAVLFRGGAQRLRFSLQEGLQVVVRGRLTVYEPRGEYQVVVDYLEPKGVGALQLAFEQLKEKLAREGLFDESRKRPLPFLPRRVGVVTSLSGAAVRDILTVLHRRCPVVQVLIVPVLVQGEAAASQIAEAVRALGASGLVEVMIVGRGGGSLEDLWSFNDEAVLRAIADSAVPVVSAVGHEIDVTLADFVADYRAPTPSAAAEAVVPVLDDLVQTIEVLRRRLDRAVRVRLGPVRHQLRGHLKLMGASMLHLQRYAQRLDDLTGRLSMTFQTSLVGLRQRISACRHRLEVASSLGRVREGLTLLPQLGKRLDQGVLALLAIRRQGIRTLAAGLDSLSPLAILGRGYSILQTVPGNVVIKRAREVSAGNTIRARLGEGQLLCEIRKILSDS